MMGVEMVCYWSSNSQSPQMLPHNHGHMMYVCVFFLYCETIRNKDSLHDKYRHMKNMQYETGNPHMPDYIRRAKALHLDVLHRNHVVSSADPRNKGQLSKPPE